VLVQLDNRAATVVGVLTPAHELVALELRRQLACGGEREAECTRQLANGLALVRAHLCEDGNVPPPDGRVAAYELLELR
jgi:hypothetical protein